MDEVHKTCPIPSEAERDLPAVTSWAVAAGLQDGLQRLCQTGRTLRIQAASRLPAAAVSAAWKAPTACSPAPGVPESQAPASQRPRARTEARAGNLTGFVECLGWYHVLRMSSGHWVFFSKFSSTSLILLT